MNVQALQEIKAADAPLIQPSIRVSEAYDGSSVLFRLLRAHGWGPLLNLGYFDLLSPWTGFSFPFAQRRLARKSVRLLDLKPNSRVLDVACGRGWSTHHIASSQPGVQVTGLDLLPQHIQICHTLYGGTRGLDYQEGDATNLIFRDKTFDALICIEAAFHFDRPKFLKEAFRVLKPGGRLVIVDFVWPMRHDEHILNHPDMDIVRSVWQWKDFDSVEEYQQNATRAGFRIQKIKDWTLPVVVTFYHLCRILTWINKNTIGRNLLTRFYPETRTLDDDDWIRLEQIVKAHDYVHRRTGYLGLVLEKPL